MSVATTYGTDGKGILFPESFGHGIIAHGPLIKQDKMTIAMRVVLHENDNKPGELVVHYQCFPKFPDLQGSYFHEGTYCGTDLAAATKAFAERSATFALCCGHLTEPTPQPV